MKDYSIQQGDLLSVTLTDAGRNQFIKTPVEGWLLVTEVAVDGGVLQANFAEIGSKGYGGVVHPQFKLTSIVRGKHGELSPYAALRKLGYPVEEKTPVEKSLEADLKEAEEKAWDALARYKFQMFGYWAAIWVHLNRVGGFDRSNPFKATVDLARKVQNPCK